MSDDNISIYDEIEIEDMTYDEDMQIYHYPCPAATSSRSLWPTCATTRTLPCSLMIRVIFDKDDLPKDPEDDPELAEEPATQIPVAA
ncbi:diphthamide biosynthesis protein 3 [Colletotrichum tofieldiae]|nr:diphthamide biosynthesis protein 3 [Colletotrichum tofieldiae]